MSLNTCTITLRAAIVVALLSFGAVEIHGERFFWKIDYYNSALEAGSEDPADPRRRRTS